MSISSYPGQQERVAISDLLRELFTKISDIINTQLQLTKTEIKVGSRKMVSALIYGGVGLILGSVFVVSFGITLTLALWQVVNLVWASLITTVVYLALTGLAVFMLMKELRKNSEVIDVDLE
jgi:uncharacterized membrane protein YqjE